MPAAQTPKRLATALYAFLLILGIALYLGWGIMFNVWADMGIYSIAVILVGFGLVGIFLYGR